MPTRCCLWKVTEYNVAWTFLPPTLRKSDFCVSEAQEQPIFWTSYHMSRAQNMWDFLTAVFAFGLIEFEGLLLYEPCFQRERILCFLPQLHLKSPSKLLLGGEREPSRPGRNSKRLKETTERFSSIFYPLSSPPLSFPILAFVYRESGEKWQMARWSKSISARAQQMPICD